MSSTPFFYVSMFKEISTRDEARPAGSAKLTARERTKLIMCLIVPTNGTRGRNSFSMLLFLALSDTPSFASTQHDSYSWLFWTSSTIGARD